MRVNKFGYIVVCICFLKLIVSGHGTQNGSNFNQVAHHDANNNRCDVNCSKIKNGSSLSIAESGLSMVNNGEIAILTNDKTDVNGKCKGKRNFDSLDNHNDSKPPLKRRRLIKKSSMIRSRTPPPSVAHNSHRVSIHNKICNLNDLTSNKTNLRSTNVNCSSNINHDNFHQNRLFNGQNSIISTNSRISSGRIRSSFKTNNNNNYHNTSINNDNIKTMENNCQNTVDFLPSISHQAQSSNDSATSAMPDLVSLSAASNRNKEKSKVHSRLGMNMSSNVNTNHNHSQYGHKDNNNSNKKNVKKQSTNVVSDTTVNSTIGAKSKGPVSDDDIDMDSNGNSNSNSNSNNSNSNGNNNSGNNSNDRSSNNSNSHSYNYNDDRKADIAANKLYENVKCIYDTEYYLKKYDNHCVNNLYYSCHEHILEKLDSDRKQPRPLDRKQFRKVCDTSLKIPDRYKAMDEMLSTVDSWNNEAVQKAWKEEMLKLVDNEDFENAKDFLQVILNATDAFVHRLAKADQHIYNEDPIRRCWDPFMMVSSLCRCVELYYCSNENLRESAPEDLDCMSYLQCSYS